MCMCTHTYVFQVHDAKILDNLNWEKKKNESEKTNSNVWIICEKKYNANSLQTAISKQFYTNNNEQLQRKWLSQC